MEPTDPDFKRRSKFLSKILRHKPEMVGVELDKQGWVDIDLLLDAIQAKDIRYTREVLDEVVRLNNKNRFEVSEDGSRIRARQGHSIEVILDLEPVHPPRILFHGTPLKNLESIHAEGIKKMNRHHVHLSPDPQTARNVGERRGQAGLLIIEAEKMAEEGFEFFKTTNGVWLTDYVPPEFIR